MGPFSNFECDNQDQFDAAMHAVRDNVVVFESWPDSWARYRLPVYRLKIKVGVQEFTLMYECNDRKNADAYAEMVRKGLAYLVCGIDA